MSQRLPTPGGDSGTWGDILNGYLGVTHNSDGTQANGSVPEAAFAFTDVTTANASTAMHGLLLKLDNVSTHFMSGTGAWTAPIDRLGLVPTAVKTAAYTAVASDLVPVDTTSGAITITLPNAPADQSVVAVKYVIQGSTNIVTINCAGSDVFNKASGSTAAALNLVGQGFLLQYKATGAIWYIVADDMPLNGAMYATNVQTAAYTPVLTDMNKVVEVNAASATTVTIPTNATTAFPIGAAVSFFQQGAGQVVFVAASGATILSPSSKLKLTGQYSSGAIRKHATNEWVLAGDLSA